MFRTGLGRTAHIITVTLFLALAGCSGATTSFSSQRSVGSTVYLSLSSTDVSFDGTSLVGSVYITAANAAGQPVSGFTPTVSIVSSTSTFSFLTAKLTNIASSLGLIQMQSVQYSLLPCTTSDSNGSVVCKVNVASGSGTLQLQINGNTAATPLDVSLVIYPPPSLTVVSPNQVDAGTAATSISLTGTNLRSGMSVSVGSLECTNVQVLSSTSASCSLPGTTSLGLLDVKIKNADKQFYLIPAALNVRDRFAPVITMSSAPSALSNSANTTIAFSLTDNVASAANITLACFLDGVSKACSTPSLSLTGLSEGLHSLVIQAGDPTGNVASNTISWTVDTLAPTLTFDNSGLGSSPSSSNSTRSVSVGGDGVAAYKSVIIRTGTCAAADFSPATEANVSVPISVAISTDGNYTICAIGRDAAGNWQTTPSSSFTLAIDTTIPYIVSIAGNLATPTNDSTARDLTMMGTDVIAYRAVTLKNVSDCSSANFSSVTESPVTSTYSMSFTGEGNYLVCAIGRNAANTWQPTATASTILVLDTTPPTLDAISLGTSPSTSATNRSIVLSGTGVVQYKAIQYISGSCDATALSSAAAKPITQAFTLTVAADATYRVCAIGMDTANNWQVTPTVSSALVIDATAPTLTFTAPDQGTSATAGVTVQGTCENGLQVTLAGAGIFSSTTATCSTGVFSQAITFSSGDGSKSISATQTDAAGNVGTVSRSFVRDTVAPAVAITLPAANTTGISGLTISGTCEVGLTVNLSGTGLDSPSSTACNNGVFSQAIVFQTGNGTKNIVVSQTDAAGNTGTDNRNFIEDNLAPDLSITGPAADTPAKTGVTITGACEDGLAIALSGAGLASPTSATCTAGAFSQAITFTPGDGPKTITLNQADAAGNSTTVSRNFIKDTTAPALTFTTGVQNQSSNGNAAAFSGTCEAGLTITATYNSTTEGTTTCSTDGVWTYSSAAQTTDGARTYTFTETDAAGNTSSIAGTWTRDATPPTLSLTAPTGTPIYAGGATINITWTTADTNLAAVPIWLEYSSNGGTSWSTLSASLMNTGSYSWTAPNINSNAVQVRITSTDTFGNRSTATSSSFTIDSSPPVVILTSMTGGQLFKGGVVRAVTWTATDSNMASTPITIAYSSDNGSTWTPIATSIANSGTSNWTLPAVSGNSYLVKVTAVDSAGHSAFATSTSAFAIDATNPTLTGVTVNGQTGGVVVGTTSTVTIGWSASDTNFSSYPIALDYSTNGGSTWSSIAATVANIPSTYSWNLTPLSLGDGTAYQVRVTATDSVGNSTVLATSNFSVRASAPALTFDNGTNTNAFTSASTIAYSGGCSNGYSITVTGTDGTNTSTTCNSGVWTWTSPTVSTDGSITYTFSQNNGAYTTTITANWTRDTGAPVISSVVINGGASTTDVGNLKVAVTVGTETNMTGLKVQLALANIVSQTCPSIGSSWQSFPSSGTGTFSFNLTAPPGLKTICAWIRDAAGNTSTVASSSISFQNGTPPRITAFTVSNGVANSNFGTTKYSAGDVVNVSWTIADTEGLATNPVYLDYTTDGTTWTPIVSGYGSLSGNPTTYTTTFTGFSAPAGFFELRLRAQDLSGNWAVPLVSTPQNSGSWSVFAGSTDRGIGSGALTLALNSSLYVSNNVAINPSNGDIYAVDSGYGIVKIPSSTGIASLYMKHGTNNLSAGGGTITSSSTVVSGTAGIVFDGGYLYLFTSTGSVTSSSQIWRIDPSNDSYSLYFGGGTDTSTSASATTAYVMFDVFRFDESHSLYYFTSCASPPSSYTGSSTVRLMKVTQTAAGNPGTISAVAGNCVNGTPVSGTAATATPMGDGNNVGISSLAVWNNGANIYFRLHAQSANYKIVNGTLYSTALPAFNGNQSFQYNPTNGLLYVANNAVTAYNTTATANGETSAGTYVNSGGTGTDCADDGVTAASAACVITYRTAFGPNGQVIILDGNTGGGHPYRIRYVDPNGKIWTLAGSRPFYGIGLNPLYTRGSFRGLVNKTATTANNGSLTTFPAGLYFTDPMSGIFGTISSTAVTALWGNQSSNCAPNTYTAGFQISTGSTAGCGNSTFNPANLSLAFDADGFPWLRPTWAGLVKIDNALYPNAMTSSTDVGYTTNNWMYADPSTQNPSNVSYIYSLLNNMTFKQSATRKGFFSLSSYYATGWTSPGPVLRFFDFASNQIVHIMGTAATAAATSDTSGNLTSLTFSAACQYQSTTSGCYTQFVEGSTATEADDILYFSEGTKIRSITNPLNPGSQVLTTILTESANISNFILSPDNGRIYYVMGGYLYCYALTKDYESEDCRNRKSDVTTLAAVNGHNKGPLGPPTGMTTLKTLGAQDNMAWKDNKTLLIANGPQIYQYNVPQPSTVTQSLAYGVNLTKLPNDANLYTKLDQQLQILNERNFKAIRIGGTPDANRVTLLNYLAPRANAAGIHINFLIDVSWLVCPNSAVKFATDDWTTNYNIGYNNTYNFVLQFKDLVTDWELGNELDLKSGMAASPGAWNTGWNASEWANVSANGSADYYRNWAATLKGQSDAIAAINAQYGLHLRRIINITMTHLGFLDYLTSYGVGYEVISYHYYQNRGTSPLSLAAQQPGSAVNNWNLFTGLAAYKKPVVVNEFNCAEIYNGSYQNAANDPLYAQCLSNLRVQLNYFRKNSQIDLEGIYAYELYDEPANAAPENHFGMFFSSDTSYTTVTPKAHLYLWSQFSGGTVTPSETSVLNGFGLLPLPAW